MLTKQKIAVRAVSLLHALLSAYFLFSMILVFIGSFYQQYIVVHLLWTVLLIGTFIVQRIYHGCPITTLEKNMLKKMGEKDGYGFSNSFIVYWVRKTTGITLPLGFVKSLIYVNLILLAYSWIYLLR